MGRGRRRAWAVAITKVFSGLAGLRCLFLRARARERERGGRRVRCRRFDVGGVWFEDLVALREEWARVVLHRFAVGRGIADDEGNPRGRSES